MQSGIQTSEGCDLTIDLGGNTLKSVGPFVGSEGTQTNALRFVKGSKVTIKNGTVKTSSPDAAILIQNFADELILDNVRLEGAMATQYVLSNNFGNIVINVAVFESLDRLGNNITGGFCGKNASFIYIFPKIFAYKIE